MARAEEIALDAKLPAHGTMVTTDDNDDESVYGHVTIDDDNNNDVDYNAIALPRSALSPKSLPREQHSLLIIHLPMSGLLDPGAVDT